MAVTTKGGKSTIDSPMLVEVEVREKIVVDKDVVKGDYCVKDGASEVAKEQQRYKPVPRSPPPFPRRLKKREEEGKFKQFLSILKQLSINIPLIEALKKMPSYAKYMKDLVTKKRTVS